MFKVGDIVVGCKEGWDLDGMVGKIAREVDYMGTVVVNFERFGSYWVAEDILCLEKTYMRKIKLNEILK